MQQLGPEVRENVGEIEIYYELGHINDQWEAYKRYAMMGALSKGVLAAMFACLVVRLGEGTFLRDSYISTTGLIAILGVMAATAVYFYSRNMHTEAAQDLYSDCRDDALIIMYERGDVAVVIAKEFFGGTPKSVVAAALRLYDCGIGRTVLQIKNKED